MPDANRYLTDRGLAIYDEFTDRCGSKIRVQKSSYALEPTVWIFARDTVLAAHVCPQLTVEQAKRVRDALDAFIAETAS